MSDESHHYTPEQLEQLRRLIRAGDLISARQLVESVGLVWCDGSTPLIDKVDGSNRELGG